MGTKEFFGIAEPWLTIAWFTYLFLWPFAAILASGCWFAVALRVARNHAQSYAGFAASMSLFNITCVVLLVANLQSDFLAWFPSQSRPLVQIGIIFFPWLSMCCGLAALLVAFRRWQFVGQSFNPALKGTRLRRAP